MCVSLHQRLIAGQVDTISHASVVYHNEYRRDVKQTGISFSAMSSQSPAPVLRSSRVPHTYLNVILGSIATRSGIFNIQLQHVPLQ
jgi:hypothetical protein